MRVVFGFDLTPFLLYNPTYNIRNVRASGLATGLRNSNGALRLTGLDVRKIAFEKKFLFLFNRLLALILSRHPSVHPLLMTSNHKEFVMIRRDL